MADNYELQIENILDRFSNGIVFGNNEALQIIDKIDAKIKDLDQRVLIAEDELQKELHKLQLTDDTSPCQLNPVALHCFLNNVVQSIEHNTGLEDVIFKDLIQFCHENCIVLPCLKSMNLEDYHSVASVNICSDDTEEETLRLWIKIKKKLKSGMINIIKKLPTTSIFSSDQNKKILTDDFKEIKRTECMNDCAKHYQNCRLNYFELFCCMFSFDEVFEIYCSIRTDEIEKEFQMLKEAILREKENVTIFDSLKNIAEHTKAIIYDDKILFERLNLFKRHHFNQITEVYARNFVSFTQVFVSSYYIATNDKTEATNNFTVSDLKKFSKLFSVIKTLISAISILEKSIFESNMDLAFQSLDVASNSGHIFEFVNDNSNKKSVNWFADFQEISTVLCKVIPSYIKCIFDVLVKQKEVVDCNAESTIFVIERLVYHPVHAYPLRVSYNCSTLFTLINEMVVFRSFSNTPELNDIKETSTIALIDAFNTYINHIDESLSKVYSIPGMNIMPLYKVIADVMFIKYQILSWSERSSGDKKVDKHCNSFVLTNQRLENLQQKLVSKVTQYHLYVLKSSIVYDAHSNNWRDEKDFMEGERFSFTLEMYNYYMKGLNADLTQILPAFLCKKILKDIGGEMLIFLASRYMLIKPSYRRVKLFKADILVLLLIHKWLLLYVVKDAAEFLGENNDNIAFIHELCNSLVEMMVIISSPLQFICKAMSKNNLKNSKSDIQWLDILSKVDSTCHSVDRLTLDILIKQSVPDIQLLLQLLSYNNVITILIKSIEHFKEIFTSVDDDGDDIGSGSKLGEMFVSKQRDTLVPINRKKFLEYLFFVLLKMSRKAFISFISLFIECDNSKSFKVQKSEQFPIWLELISNHLYLFLKRILTPALDLLIHDDRCKKTPSSNFTKIQTLPCGCAASEVKDENHFKTVSSILHQCVMTTLSLLADNIHVIPEVFWTILAYVKNQPGYTASWIQQPNLGTKILASLLFAWLSEKDNFAYLSYYTVLSEETFENIKDFAELLWHIIYNLTHDVTDDPKISMAIFKDLQNSSEEIQTILTSLSLWCNRTKYLASDETSDIGITCSSSNYDSTLVLCESQSDIDRMKYIFSIIKTNQKLIKRMLYPDEDQVTTESFESALDFNPLTESRNIGDFRLNHIEIMEKELDYELLVSQIPFGKFRTLIWNRFEFQNNVDDILTDEEKFFVSKIKDQLHLDVHE